jgi:O-antigen biosynthesis protein
MFAFFAATPNPCHPWRVEKFCCALRRMISDLKIFEEPHHQALEFLSVRALASGDIATAFRLSDRRCRIKPTPEPHCYVLRADAQFRMGDKRTALRDIARVIEIDPNNIVANRRMLTWSEGPSQHEAANTLIAHDRDTETLLQAMAVLRREGRAAFASARIANDKIHGWAAWQSSGAVNVMIAEECSAMTLTLSPDPSHPLAGAIGNAANFTVPVPASDRTQFVAISFEGETLVSMRTSGKVFQPAPTFGGPAVKRRSHPWHRKVVSGPLPTIIVPVFGDFDATKACIDSLLNQAPGSTRCPLIVIDDATPDPCIRGYLVKIAKEDHVILLTNERNRGFVESINRGLAEAGDGDVLLLNADTIVPSGFADRLAAAARTSADIGTVTPMSNNGEFTSFPVPNTQNRLPCFEEILAIDRVAAEVNGGRIVDIPNGIGFCLYVTRECLNAVGSLSNDYHRGYLEDVDFCLRARELGFRNVCAPSVFVGHAGSRSFGKEKRSLVVRNLAIVERKFPEYRGECAAFIALDPLRASRQAIERADPPCNHLPYLLVTGEGAVADVVYERAQNILLEGRAALILTVCRRADGAAARIENPSAASPQSIGFDLGVIDEIEALFDYLRAVKPSRIEIADPANIPIALLDGLTGLDIPYDILVADSGLLGDGDILSIGESSGSRLPTGSSSHSLERRCDVESQTASRAKYLREIAAKADRLLAPCTQAAAFAAQNFATRPLIKVEIGEGPKRGGRPTASQSTPRHESRLRLGIIPIRTGVREQLFMRNIAIGLNKYCSNSSTVVIGSTLDDLDLMHIENTFVTGFVDVSEIDDICRAYALGSLFLCVTRPLFGHPLQSSARASGLPLAYFDWSNGRCIPRSNDLLLDPVAPLAEVIGVLVKWMKAY